MSFQRMLMIFDFCHKNAISAESSQMEKELGLRPTHFFIVPANIYLIYVVACGGGAAGFCADLQKKIAGQGGAAGLVQKTTLDVHPGQRFEIFIGNGGKYHSAHEPLSGLQIEQSVFEFRQPQDTILFDCEKNSVVVRAGGGKGFSGGRALVKEICSENGMASFQNGGTGFCDANGKWVGYGGGGGGGRHGGSGGCVYSNKKTSKPEDAEEFTGSGGGGSALLLTDGSKHFLPGAGASGYLHIQFDR